MVVVVPPFLPVFVEKPLWGVDVAATVEPADKELLTLLSCVDVDDESSRCFCCTVIGVDNDDDSGGLDDDDDDDDEKQREVPIKLR